MVKVKEFYADPKMEVIRFEVEDIILTSGTDDYDEGGDGDWESSGDGWDS